MWQGAFKSELMKIAGVGWDLHGYHREPKRPKLTPAEAAAEKQWNTDFDAHLARRKEEVGPAPKIFSGLRHAGWQKSVKKWEKENPFKSSVDTKVLPLDEFDYERESRIQTPFDDLTSYKLNDRLDFDTKVNPGALHAYTTEYAYSDKPYEKRLSKEDLKKVVDIYKKKAEGYEGNNPEYASNIKRATTAFIQKAEHLIKDPKLKFARLEYE